MVKDPPSNAGDAGLIPGQGTKILHTPGQLSPPSGAHAPWLERSPHMATKRATAKTRCHHK